MRMMKGFFAILLCVCLLSACDSGEDISSDESVSVTETEKSTVSTENSSSESEETEKSESKNDTEDVHLPKDKFKN